MTDNVVPFFTAYRPDDVLEQAKGEFQNLVIIGWNHDGELDVRASTNTSREETLWLIETFKRDLLFNPRKGD